MRRIKLLLPMTLTKTEYPTNDKKSAVLLRIVGCVEEDSDNNQVIPNINGFELLASLIKFAYIHNKGVYRFIIQGGDPLVSIKSVRNLGFFINFFNIIHHTIHDLENYNHNKYVATMMSSIFDGEIRKMDLLKILKQLEFFIYTNKPIEEVQTEFLEKIKLPKLVKYIKTGEYTEGLHQENKKDKHIYTLKSKNQKLWTYRVKQSEALPYSDIQSYINLTTDGVLKYSDFSLTEKFMKHHGLSTT